MATKTMTTNPRAKRLTDAEKKEIIERWNILKDEKYARENLYG